MQKKLTVLIILAVLSLGLGGCIKPYRPSVQQGNIIRQDMLDKLKPGMTRDQVLFIMGTPILIETFEMDRSDYVYTFQPGYGSLKKERITLRFKNDRLQQIIGTLHSEPAPPTKTKTAEEPAATNKTTQFTSVKNN